MNNIYPIGESIPRKDGKDKVLGRAKYGADYTLPGQLNGALCRSPYAHARILRVDASAALALPGVYGVITGEDCKLRYGHMIADQPVLAYDKVLYYGEPVAAVAAQSEEIAREAAYLIKVEYEPLPVVNSLEDALAPKALLHEKWSDYTIYGGVDPIDHSNIMDQFYLRHGDAEAGFAEADIIVENEFYVSALQHTLIEPHTVIADANEDFCHIWAPDQSPFYIRGVIANAFGYANHQVRLTCTEIGGGFGGKLEARLEPIAVALSRAVHRPVRLTNDRFEEYIGTVTRAPVLFKIKTGAKKDGHLIAQQVKIWWDTGAYTTYGPRVNYNAGYASNGPYFVPNSSVESFCVATNKSLGSAYRGFGVAEVCSAYESNMDEIADRLGMDPLEFRLMNVLRDGKESVTGEIMESVGVTDCLKAATEAIGWADKPRRWTTPEGKLRGKGVACFIKLTGTPSTTSIILHFNSDATLTLLSGSREMGQGVMTVLPMMAASVLGMDLERIRMSQVDTDLTPYDKTTTSSRSTFHGGNAVLEAAQSVRDQLMFLVAKKWKVDPATVRFDHGTFTCTQDAALTMHIHEVGKKGVLKEELPVIGVGKFGSKDIFDVPDKATHRSKKPTIMWMMGAQAAEVEVDPDTGKVTIIQIGASNDVGKAINPMGCMQQIEGGVNMGVGPALYEEMIYSDGVLLNANMADYKVTTFMDSDFTTHVRMVECPNPDGPYGVKGIGEPGTAPTAPAITNAVAAAVDAKFHRIPIQPQDVLKLKK